MKKHIILLMVGMIMWSCTKVLNYNGAQKEPALYIVGNLMDTAETSGYIFVGETEFFADGVNMWCDPEAMVKVKRGEEEWSVLNYTDLLGYAMSLKGVETGDTVRMEVKSKDYETASACAIMPPHIDIDLVKFDSTTEAERRASKGMDYFYSYAIIDLSCEGYDKGDWYFDLEIEADVERKYTYIHWVNERMVIDTVCDTLKDVELAWWSRDNIFYGDSEIDENVDIWSMIYDSDEEYTHLVMTEPHVRAKVYLTLEESDSRNYKSQCLKLKFKSRVTSYDRYNYQKTANAAQNSDVNPFVEPTQLWNNVKSGSRNAGIFTITTVRSSVYNLH